MMLQERCRKGIFGDDRGVLPLLSQQLKHGLLCWPVELIFITKIAGIPVLPNPMIQSSHPQRVSSLSPENAGNHFSYPLFGFCVGTQFVAWANGGYSFSPFCAAIDVPNAVSCAQIKTRVCLLQPSIFSLTLLPHSICFSWNLTVTAPKGQFS